MANSDIEAQTLTVGTFAVSRPSRLGCILDDGFDTG